MGVPQSSSIYRLDFHGFSMISHPAIGYLHVWKPPFKHIYVLKLELMKRNILAVSLQGMSPSIDKILLPCSGELISINQHVFWCRVAGF